MSVESFGSIAERVDVSEIERETHPIILATRAIEVVDHASAQRAGDWLGKIRTARKGVADWFEGMVADAHRAHKTLTTKRGQVDAPLAEAEAAIKGKLGVWTEGQDRIRRAEEDRLRREAAEADRRRREAERQKRELEAMERAAALEALGKSAEAERVIEQAIAAPEPEPAAPAIYIPPAPKIKGVTATQVWGAVGSYTVTDFAALPDRYKQINDAAIREHLRRWRGSNPIPGVVAGPTQRVSGRS